MHNQHFSRRMQQTIERVTPKPQTCPITRLTSLSGFICLSVLASSLLLIGPTTQGQDSSDQQDQLSSKQSGFLSDYSKLEPDPKNTNLLIYWKNPDVLKNSSKFILEPVIVYLLPQAEERGIDPEQLEKLARTFDDALRDELTKSGRYQIVTKPGPGVMLLRVAITNVAPNGAKTNAAIKGAATGASVMFAPGASLLVPRFSVGKVSIEGEMVDSVSGDEEVAFMTSKSGRRYFSGLKAYQTWGDINAAFRSWAKNFRQRLDQAYQS
jgi:Protein of unknown function (DUF3313)